MYAGMLRIVAPSKVVAVLPCNSTIPFGQHHTLVYPCEKLMGDIISKCLNSVE